MERTVLVPLYISFTRTRKNSAQQGMAASLRAGVLNNPALRSASRFARRFRRFSEDCFKPPHWRARSAHFSALLRFREIVLAKRLITG